MDGACPVMRGEGYVDERETVRHDRRYSTIYYYYDDVCMVTRPMSPDGEPDRESYNISDDDALVCGWFTVSLSRRCLSGRCEDDAGREWD